MTTSKKTKLGKGGSTLVGETLVHVIECGALYVRAMDPCAHFVHG